MQKIETFYRNYDLIDCGNGRRLERFGDYVIDRPAPQALIDRKLDAFVWHRADFRFEEDRWLDNKDTEVTGDVIWDIEVANIYFKLRLSQNGQLGIFPEQFINWVWLDAVITDHLKKLGTKLYNEEKKFNVLNTFSYTGGASMFCASASKKFASEICHVDGSKSSVNWAGENAKMNGLKNIRWIVDDVMTFMKREVKREKFYDGIILDPPAFGRGKNKTWTFNKDLQELLSTSKSLMSPAGPLFFLISCHDQDIESTGLRDFVSDALNIPERFMETVELNIPSNRGNPLPCGVCIRFKKS
ncbi:MAG: class I SAM-dependent methyltransferase [Proteobacteria bacterium]|nr:class I SAM-dependent methyltransferase [Pseudomonadota bacterium]